MSNPLKAIGKTFKKVWKATKKFVLPVLAIGAVVLTGGAALGILPALGAGGLGLSAGLASVVSSAGVGGMLGGATAALMGKNVLKGITAGGVIGAATGGLGLALKPATTAASVAGSGGAAGNAATLPLSSGTVSSLTAGAAREAGGAILPLSASTVSGLGAGAAREVATSLAPAASSGLSSALGGAGRLISGINPTVGAGLIAGLGQGISGYAQAKSAEGMQDRQNERTDENYSTIGSSWAPMAPRSIGLGAGTQRRGIWKVDPKSGEIYQEFA